MENYSIIISTQAIVAWQDDLKIHCLEFLRNGLKAVKARFHPNISSILLLFALDPISV